MKNINTNEQKINLIAYPGVMQAKKGMTTLDLGPTGSRAAENVTRQRKRLNLTYAALEKRLEDAGHRIPALGLRRIEAKARKIDIDDLLALAYALECTPMFLLAPVAPTESVTAVPDGEFVWEEIRNWIAGAVKLTPADIAAHWSSVAAESENQLRHWSEKLEKLKADGESSNLTRRYEQLIGEALGRNQLATERMTHFLDDFEDHDSFLSVSHDD